MNNSNQGAIIKSFIMMTVVMAFIGGFVLSGDLEKTMKKSADNDTVESDDVYTANIKGNKTLGFDEKLVMSDDESNYVIDLGTYAGTSNIYFTLNYGSTQKELKVTRFTYDSEETQEYVLNFTGNVVDVFFGQFDNDPLHNVVFYLLDNGDVCYSFVEEMVKEDSYGMYLTVEKLPGIAKFYSGESCNEETQACTTTTLAQAKDGKIYDLNKYIIK